MLSRLIRRTHMYLALFLLPWMVMYALSTLAMNHGLGAPPEWEKVGERRVSEPATRVADPAGAASRILRELDMDGRHSVRRSDGGDVLTIVRESVPARQRITYTRETGEAVIEREVVAPATLLERLHRRRGYGTGYRADDVWALGVDVVIAAMVFWVLSGLWMWWEMRVLRRPGAFFAALGALLFFILVAVV